MPDKGKSKSPRRKRRKIRLARSTYSLRAFAWGVAEWAKQFTTPDGTLAFPSPDKRRALEIRLTVLAVLAAERHWTDLREVDRDAVDVLFALTLGPGMREAWQHQWKQIGSVGGAPVLLRCHNLQHYPKAAISLNTALTALSADGLAGQLAQDPEGQSRILGQLERVSTVWDKVYRKHRPPEKDLTWEYIACDLLEGIDRAMQGSKARQPASKAAAEAREPLVGKRMGEPSTDPEPVAHLKPSHAKAKALYDWAMEHVEGADNMTYAELFEKLTNDPRCAGEGLPNNAEAFARYCRAAGVRRHTPRHEKGATRSVRRASDL